MSSVSGTKTSNPGQTWSLVSAAAGTAASIAAAATSAPILRARRLTAQRFGVYQIGEVYARSVTFIAVPSSGFTPKRLAS